MDEKNVNYSRKDHAYIASISSKATEADSKGRLGTVFISLGRGKEKGEKQSGSFLAVGWGLETSGTQQMRVESEHSQTSNLT